MREPSAPELLDDIHARIDSYLDRDDNSCIFGIPTSASEADSHGRGS